MNITMIRFCVLVTTTAFASIFTACNGSGDDSGANVSTGGTTPANTAVGGSSAVGPGTGGTSSIGSSSAGAEKFSFFAISYKAIVALSGTTKGFGGDLRYGETGAGAGLRGADKICTQVAERSMPKNGKQWRAFLSVTDGGNGSPVAAIDRIGEGPWYDRLGRLFAAQKADLLSTRPVGIDTTIANDLPNEDGVLNHDPDGTGQVDNHDTLTGSNATGTLYSATATCSDWTSSAADTSKKPRVGHTWPTGGTTGGTGRPGGGGIGGTMAHWISALDESGCAPGVNLIETGAPGNDGTVGSGGGYGGFYCFAMTP